MPDTRPLQCCCSCTAGKKSCYVSAIYSMAYHLLVIGILYATQDEPALSTSSTLSSTIAPVTPTTSSPTTSPVTSTTLSPTTSPVTSTTLSPTTSPVSSTTISPTTAPVTNFTSSLLITPTTQPFLNDTKYITDGTGTQNSRNDETNNTDYRKNLNNMSNEVTDLGDTSKFEEKNVTASQNNTAHKNTKKGTLNGKIENDQLVTSNTTVNQKDNEDEGKVLNETRITNEAERPLKREDFPVVNSLEQIMMVLSLFGLMTAVLLILGLRQDKALLMLPWLFTFGGLMAVDIIYIPYTIYHLVRLRQVNPEVALVQSLNLLVVLCNMYCFCCVYSRFRSYCKAERRGSEDTQGVVYTAPRNRGKVASISFGNSAFGQRGSLTNQLVDQQHSDNLQTDNTASCTQNKNRKGNKCKQQRTSCEEGKNI